jgi:hypothetical protein
MYLYFKLWTKELSSGQSLNSTYKTATFNFICGTKELSSDQQVNSLTLSRQLKLIPLPNVFVFQTEEAGWSLR